MRTHILRYSVYTVLFALAACSRPYGPPEDDNGGGASLSFDVTASTGGSLWSEDRLFTFTIPPYALGDDAEVTIRRSVDSHNGVISYVYGVSLTPEDVSISPSAQMIASFKINDSVINDIGEGNLAIGTRPDASDAFILWFVPYDDIAGTASLNTATLGEFVAVDGATYDAQECACDVSSSCSASCSCDPDCGSSSECTWSQFECGDGSCVPQSYVCDDYDDCADGSDEAGCGTSGGCTSSQFDCGGGYCVPDYYVCDDYSDCYDGSDEVGCGCSSYQFECNDGYCVSSSYVCDGYGDCYDDSDEAGCATGDAYEVDDTAAEARVIEPGETYTGYSLHNGYDVDMTTFTLTEWSTVTLTTTGTSGDPYMQLFTADEELITYNYDSYSSYYYNFPTITDVLPPGTYLCWVGSEYGSVPSYSLSLTATPAAPQLDAPTNVSATYASGTITVTWTASLGATSYNLYYDDDSYAPADPSFTASQGAPPHNIVGESATLTGIPGPRTVYVWVKAVAETVESSSSYYTYVTIPAAPDPYEDDDSFAQARVLEPGEAQQHTQDSTADVDYAVFSLDTQSDIAVEALGCGSDVYLYNEQQAEVTHVWSSGGNATLVRSGLAAGSYYVKVVPYYYSTCAYTLRLTTAGVATPPSDVTAVAEAGVVTVSWSPVPNATSYQVHYDQDGVAPFYSYAATEGSSPVTVTATSLALHGLAVGQTYYFAVVARNPINVSGYSQVVSVTLLGTPDAYETDDTTADAKVLGSTTQNRSIHQGGDVDYATFMLTGASDVVIETSGSSGDTMLALLDESGAELATDDDTGTGSFSKLTLPALAAGTYLVRVQAKSSTAIIASYTLALTAALLPDAPQSLVATAGAGSVTLSWTAVSGATGYRVYYDDDTDNPPYSTSVIATQGASPVSTTATTLTLTGLPAGTTFAIAVRAANGTVLSAYSNEVSATVQ